MGVYENADFKTQIGGNTMTFSIYEVPGEEKVIMLSVADEHRINKVTLMGTAAEMKDLQAKLAKTILEAEKK
jgi:hypothetical protein